VSLSEKYQRRLHILHLSTAIEAEYLREHKPPWLTVEVTPQHLLLNTAAYGEIGTLAQMNPPLRSVHDNEVLWQALLDGVIDFIATDHAPHTLEAEPFWMPEIGLGIGRCPELFTDSLEEVLSWFDDKGDLPFGRSLSPS
jgi:dihydroorotase